ncbi:MAG: polyphosphate:AMP phosphotransferase [Gammaproteobacteria bacterium]|nr:polyphosphate:AMP phosphotransferase [Gammaproteobacteria bacterium]
MFETAELGRKVDKKTFAAEEPKLHTALLEVQRTLREATFPVIVIVSGVEGAGKGEVVNLLNKWLDARGIQTYAFWDESEEERERPRYWRFWRALPPRGTVGIMFGSWYTQPIVRNVFEQIDADAYERELHRIVEFEQLLIDDGALIVKFWFHLTKKDQRKRLEEELGGKAASPQLKKFSKHYKRFAAVSERAIRVTDTGPSPWYVIEAADRRYRDLTVGRTLLAAIERRLQRAQAAHEPPGSKPPPAPLSKESALTVLDQVDLARTLSTRNYAKQLARYQARLRQLAWKAKQQKRNTVLVFEGWDAAGKGGAIRRVTAAMDARLFRVISVAAPTDEEKAQHYLWRFWRHLPRAGYVTIYDRSWYGRVLVERVEGFAREDEWLRAYQEINDFEEQLAEHGVVLAKFWLHISTEEQLRRFKEREMIEWKQHKITAEDWRNREKWEPYEAAVNDMVARTSTDYAPWSLIGGNDKRCARVDVVRTVCERLEAALD